MRPDPEPPATRRSPDVDAYLDAFPAQVRTVLEAVRDAVHRGVPGAEETISYQIPAVRRDGKVLVYFAGWTNHVSVYPLPAPDEAMDRELASYRSGRGTAKFPLDRPVPYDLIERLAALTARQRTGH